MNIDLLKEKSKELSTISVLMEPDLAVLSHKYIYKKILLSDCEISKDLFEKEFYDFIIENSILDETLPIVESFIKKEKYLKKVNLSNELEIKISKYLGLICLLLEETKDKDFILKVFMLVIEFSNLYDICSIIEKGNYKGYNDYLNSGRGK